MFKRIVIALGVVFCLLGVVSAFNAGRQLVVDYDNFKKIVIWVAQKQALEEQQRQRQQQAAARPPVPAPTPSPSVASPEPPEKK